MLHKVLQDVLIKRIFSNETLLEIFTNVAMGLFDVWNFSFRNFILCMLHATCDM